MKTILLTGATDGIGLHTTHALLAQGHCVLAHGRSADKLADLQKQADTDRLQTYCADLSDLDAVRHMADQVCQDQGSIDVLVNNAGVLKAPVTQTSDGLDIRFVVNTLAPALLSQKVVSCMPASGRVLNLSSAAQAAVSIPALQGGAALDDMAAYSQSKLALTQWSFWQAAQIEQAVVAINPGSLLATKMVREGFGIAGNDVQIGVDILLRACLSDEFQDKTGTYFDGDSNQFADPHPDALDSSSNQRIAATILSMIGRGTAESGASPA